MCVAVVWGILGYGTDPKEYACSSTAVTRVRCCFANWSKDVPHASDFLVIAICTTPEEAKHVFSSKRDEIEKPHEETFVV